ncbi:MAG TPA: ParB/RepB/Spo0J family partition protein [Candidatus Merdivicinus excrementipullorum]|uniref:ParB/RepB/Spo0J family partition protein n=1 Tax=Candidatus Merdivicinus excrementipullorum TaxID=2840867 RepID=A0A9D1FQR1_9FIRM|nr:ParB/RepB/Spo0J family partition protein [Candidatus Merdivicinus excrementipullorum]
MAKKPGGLGKGLDALFLDNDTDPSSEGGVMLRLTDIEPNKNQPRKEFDEQALSELADSIREHGIIQPLLVRRLETGGYQLVAGERRWRAARMVGLAEVPAVIKELSEVQVMEMALIENLQREDLNPLEEANGYKELMNACNLTQEQVAKRVGKSRSAVANSLRLLNLPQEIRPFVVQGSLSAGHAKALLGIEDRAEMLKLAREAAEKGLSVRETEKKAAKLRETADSGENSTGMTSAAQDPFYQETELALSGELGRRIKVRVDAKGGGTLEISFYDKEDLSALAMRFEEK